MGILKKKERKKVKEKAEVMFQRLLGHISSWEKCWGLKGCSAPSYVLLTSAEEN